MSHRQEGVEKNYFKLVVAECGRQRIRCLHLVCGFELPRTLAISASPGLSFFFFFFFPLYNLGREQDGTYNSSLP